MGEGDPLHVVNADQTKVTGERREDGLRIG